MKTKYFLKTLIIIGITILCLRLMVDNVKASDTLYEYYSGSNDGYDSIYAGSNSFGQTFTIGSVSSNIAYNITSVKLYLQKYGSPTGNIDVKIIPFSSITGRVTTGAGQKYGSYDMSSISTSVGLYEIDLAGWFYCCPSLTYTIVVSSARGNPINCIRWYYDNTGPTSSGNKVYSNDGWYTTSSDASADYSFWVYAKKCQSSSINLDENLIHTSGTMEYNYNIDDGFNIWNNYSANNPTIHKYENKINVTGTHESVWNYDSFTLNVWANYSSFLNLYENPIHATGQQEITINDGQYNVYANYTATNPTFNKYENIIDATGTHESIFTNWIYDVWANYTGTGGGFIPFWFNFTNENISINVSIDGQGYANVTNNDTVNETNWLNMQDFSFKFDAPTFLFIYLFAILFMIFNNKTNELFIETHSSMIFTMFTIVLLLGIEVGEFVTDFGFTDIQRILLLPFLPVFIILLWLNTVKD